MASLTNSVSARDYPPTPPSEPTGIPADVMTTASPAAGSIVGEKHIWLVTGPAGCGKTSVAEYLQQHLALPYLEGDTFHTAENVKKMASGQALTDTDRWDWLILLRETALKTLAAGPSGVIVTCSALKRKYRDVMRVAAYHHPNVRVHFIFLQATEALLIQRVALRMDHYMKDFMVRSQFASLETPQVDEHDVRAVDASHAPDVVQSLSLGVVKKVMSPTPN